MTSIEDRLSHAICRLLHQIALHEHTTCHMVEVNNDQPIAPPSGTH